jgi:hypothetical protein
VFVPRQEDVIDSRLLRIDYDFYTASYARK